MCVASQKSDDVYQLNSTAYGNQHVVLMALWIIKTMCFTHTHMTQHIVRVYSFKRYDFYLQI